jgi:uncharacterized phage-associated protein
MAHSSLVIANEFIRRSLKSEACPVTQMQVQKLVYFAHGWYLALTGKPLVEDAVQAWDFGPVFPTLYSAVRKFGRNKIDRVLLWGEDTPFTFDDAGEAVEELTADESAIIDQVWTAYGKFPAFKLSALTHEPGTPWASVFESGKNKPISDAEIQGYFSNLMQAA